MAQGLQNGGMHLAATTLFFRVHTRVLTTLSVALAITCLCLASPVRPVTHRLDCAAGKGVVQTAIPLESPRQELPRTVIRLFLLLPHLLPHDN